MELERAYGALDPLTHPFPFCPWFPNLSQNMPQWYSTYAIIPHKFYERMRAIFLLLRLRY